MRVGRFEPAYHLFSSKRSYYLLSPYDVYEYPTGGNDFLFGDNQIGVEATGRFGRDSNMPPGSSTERARSPTTTSSRTSI